MLASQGSSSHVAGGIVVRQSIGQQSAIGNYKNSNLIVGQGFQQNGKMKPTATPSVVINTKTYPNPFIDKVNFQFSSPVEGPVKISLFDILGRLVFTAEKFPTNNIVTIDNLFFPEGEYFAKLTANNFTYTTNLLKSK
ncbi:MAG: hypothetical protein RIQ59_279 [Bacteroidota bacterium]|jgi:hypothetical protein